MDKKALSERDIRRGGNVSGDEPHAATGAFDFVLANPPFTESDDVPPAFFYDEPLPPTGKRVLFTAAEINRAMDQPGDGQAAGLGAGMQNLAQPAGFEPTTPAFGVPIQAYYPCLPKREEIYFHLISKYKMPYYLGSGRGLIYPHFPISAYPVLTQKRRPQATFAPSLSLNDEGRANFCLPSRVSKSGLGGSMHEDQQAHR